MDEDMICLVAMETRKVVTVEEYSIVRGLRNAVCDTVCKRYPISVKKIGVMDTYGTSGPAKELLNKYGLDAE